MDIKVGRNWGLFAAGIALVIIGFVLLMVPGLTLVSIAVIAGCMFLAAGIVDAYAYFKYREAEGLSGWALAYAICDIILGVLFIVHPIASAVVIPWVMGIFVVAYGIFEIVAAVRFHDAAQHTVHPSAAQLIVHLQAFVLPAGFRLFFGQADAVKHRLCSLHKTVQILLGPLFFHCIFPIIMHRAAVHRQLTDSRHSPGTHSHYSIQAGPLPAERTIFYWNFCIFVRLPNNLQSARRN